MKHNYDSSNIIWLYVDWAEEHFNWAEEEDESLLNILQEHENFVMENSQDIENIFFDSGKLKLIFYFNSFSTSYIFKSV